MDKWDKLYETSELFYEVMTGQLFHEVLKSLSFYGNVRINSNEYNQPLFLIIYNHVLGVVKEEK